MKLKGGNSNLSLYLMSSQSKFVRLQTETGIAVSWLLYNHSSVRFVSEPISTGIAVSWLLV